MALKKISKNVTPMFSKEDYGKFAEEYNDISSKMKELDARKKHLAEVLKDAAEKVGVKDDKGSYYCDCDNFIFGRVAKHSVKLDEEKAKTYLREHKMENMIEKVVSYVVNEEMLSEAVKDGRISQEDFESLCNVTTSYSVSVTKKNVEDMPEVEKTSLKIAARKK